MSGQLTKRRITSYARRFGVAIEPFGDLGWIVPSQDPEHTPPISITEYEGRVLLNVMPVVMLNNAKKRPRVMEELLRLNAKHALAQYALAEDWQILLWAVYPVEGFGYELFAAGLEAIQQAIADELAMLVDLAA